MPTDDATYPEQQTVTAREFCVVDRDGTPRIRLGMSGDEIPRLQFLALDGSTPVIDLFVDSDETGLTLRDAKGMRRVKIITGEDGPGVILYDRSARTRAVISVDDHAENGRPDIWLTHYVTGRDHLRLSLDANGYPFLEINDDKAGKTLISIQVDEDGIVQLDRRPHVIQTMSDTPG